MPSSDSFTKPPSVLDVYKRQVPYLAYIVCSKVALQVFAALAALRASCIAVLCRDSGAVLIIHITLCKAAVLCYQYITVSHRKIVYNIVL